METPQSFRVSGSLEYPEFQVTMKELQQFMKRCVQQVQPSLWAKQLTIIAVVVLCVILTLHYFDMKFDPLQFAAYVALWICIETLLRIQYARVLGKTIFKHRKRIIDPLEVAIDYYGFHFSHPNAEDRIGWATVLELRQKADMLMIFISPVHVYMIPKRWFPDDATWEACLAFSQRQLEASRQAVAAT